MTRKSVPPLTSESDTFKFSMPPGWALQVSPSGVVFLGPLGEEVTLSASPLKGEARVAPQKAEAPVRREESKSSDGRLVAELVADGPPPRVTLHFTGPAESRSSLDDLEKALRQIEWFPPQQKRRRKLW